ncbi:uncharacterized protein LOC114315474 [Camellia sinensis]|uniref:uncharacterized protein LOC114315474 n=1 Tax=Camellia sinensis TaxID=4442 RepID=UPI0010366C01|nr:uncharacterized protein LOC114315474 [Camellia sinensis]
MVKGLAHELRQARQQNTGTTSTQAEQTDGRREVPSPPPPVPQVPSQPALYGDGTLTLIKEFKKMNPSKFQGAFTLDDDTRRWWMMIREGNPSLTWARFLELFYDKHFPLSVQDRKTMKFQMLTQGNKTVAEYDRAFTELARYAPHMANNEYMKARKFESGIWGPIQDRVNMLNMSTYAGVLDKAILAEANLSRSQSSGENQRKRQDYDNR